MKNCHTWMLSLALVGLVGCADEPTVVPDPSQTTGETNNEPANNDPANNDPANNDLPIELPDGVQVSVEVVPLEWGLFGGPAGDTVAAAATNRAGLAELQIGPGAHALRVTVDSDVVIDVSTTTADRLVPLSGDIAAQPFFMPAGATVTIETRQVPGGWSVSARDETAERVVAIDSTDSASDAGAWFHERFEAVLSASDAQYATAELMGAVRDHGGPIVTERGVLFLAPAPDGAPAPQIRGTWNDFAADPNAELHRVTPGMWARFIEVPPGPQQYKIHYPDGDAWVTDFSNRHITWDGFDPGTVGAFNSVLAPQGARTVWLPQVDSPQLSNQRDVYVHLPASYDATSDDFAALYIHDGNESIVRSQMHLVADQMAASGAAQGTILVFVALPSQNVRLTEYTMGTAGSRGDDYIEFLAATLVPLTDQLFRTRPDRRARGLFGASLGGLISYWGAMQRPDVFGYTAGMSASFFWGDNFLIDEIRARGCQNVVYYLDSGSPDDNFEVTHVMRETLAELGCNFDYTLEPNGRHDWSFWRGRFGGVLVDFTDASGG